jgi:hypothetical protein
MGRIEQFHEACSTNQTDPLTLEERERTAHFKPSVIKARREPNFLEQVCSFRSDRSKNSGSQAIPDGIGELPGDRDDPAEIAGRIEDKTSDDPSNRLV